MKTKHFIMFLLFISLGLVSCSDNDDEQFFLYEKSGDIFFPDKPISDTTLEIISGSSIGVTGGVPPYTMKTGDENIAVARYFEKGDYIMVSPIKLGTTYLIVRDANGLIAKIGVEVVQGKQSFCSDEMRVQIDGVSGDEKTALERKVIEDSDMYATGKMCFVYDTGENGTLTITPSEDNESIDIIAPFTKITKKVDGKYIFVYSASYSGTNHDFYLVSPERPQKKDENNTRYIGLGYELWLVEDVTEIYNKTYANVTSVKRIYEGRLSR